MNHRENEQLRQCKREEARLRKCQIHKQKIHKSPHRTHFWNNLVGDQNTIEKHCSQNHQHESRNHHGKRRSIQQAGKPIINRCNRRGQGQIHRIRHESRNPQCHRQNGQHNVLNDITLTEKLYQHI